jgi:hypothetical protein
LRLRAAAVAALALWTPAASAAAREARIAILVTASVSDGALGAIAPQSWMKDLDAALARYRIVNPGVSAPPTLADCRKAPADFLVSASFELRPQLPGLSSGRGRPAGQARLHVVDCLTGAVAGDKLVAFESDPVDAAPGDAGPAADSRWQREIPAAFAKHPLDLQRPSRVVAVAPPLAHVGTRDATLRPGDVLRDVATANVVLRERPIVLTVTQVLADGVEVQFDAGGERPALGDYVERCCGH